MKKQSGAGATSGPNSTPFRCRLAHWSCFSDVAFVVLLEAFQLGLHHALHFVLHNDHSIGNRTTAITLQQTREGGKRRRRTDGVG